MKKTILLVEDDASLRRVMEFQLAEKGYAVRAAGDGEQALRLFREEPPDLVVTDMTLPRVGGLELLRAVKREAPRVPVIVITAFGTIETAVQAMRDGAFHYVTKPISNEELALVVAKALDYGALTEENVRLRRELQERHRLGNILGDSAAMKRVNEVVARVAGRDVTVLLEGESGTGKELVARAIHYNSARAAGPFVPVNCGAIPKDLVESELFGARKGAFTGATHDRAGQFEQADQGTIFLDEIVELPPEAQVKLLRVLQDRVVAPLGAETPVPLDVRVIAATNRSLETAVAEGDLREDIFYRLNVVTISLPPLRDRRDDIPLLVRHFLEKFGQPQCKVSPEASEVLSRGHWPGNVRQLENAIQRALVLQRNPGEITAEDLPPELAAPSPKPVLAGSEFPDEGINLEDNEKVLIQMALAKAGNNQTRAAQLLGISRHVLLYRMQKYGLR
ncbi:MAG: sigma-54 dependent transcriptional regulator [Candidatus Brocadiia bacterium]|jgi:two-component system NtrC family response regulator